MRASICLLAVPVAVGVAASLAAQQAPYKSGDDALDALILDISSGHRDAAIARISSIESISGKRTLATTPTEFVDRLLGCHPTGEAKDIGFDKTKLIQVVWVCAGASYYTVFDPGYTKPYITVGEFEDQAVRNARLASRVAPPAPPPPGPPRPPEPQLSDADRAALVKTALSSLLSGKFGAVRASMAADARVTLGRRDPFAKVTVIEQDSTGADAFATVSRAAIARLGKPVSLDCDTYGCRFKFAKGDRILVAIVGVRRDKISYVQFIYGIRGP